MLSLSIRVLSAFGTVATAVGLLVCTEIGSTTITRVLVVCLIVSAVGVVIADIRAYAKARPKLYPLADPGIVDYMKGWLKSGGRAAIFSRDLSWADKRGAESLLNAKAQKGELVVFAARQTSLLNGLGQAGAEVYDYGKLGFLPKSRFTIVDFERTGARVAVGLTEEGKHAIYEFGARDQALMALTTDLVALARIVSNRIIP